MREKMARFMQGRYGAYGMDRLTRFLMILFLICFVITSFFRVSGLRLLPLLIFGFTYFRLLSRNIQARYRENEAYSAIENKVLKRFGGLRSALVQKKNYHIYKCPSCGQKIRIPRGKGRIMVHCPKCSSEFLRVS